MRKLITRDVFTMARLATKMNLKEDLAQIAQRAEGQTQLNVGIDMFLTIIAKVSDKSVEKEIYVFLGDVLERDPKEIEEGDPIELMDELEKDDGLKQWRDFFSRVSKLIFRS